MTAAIDNDDDFAKLIEEELTINAAFELSCKEDVVVGTGSSGTVSTRKQESEFKEECAMDKHVMAVYQRWCRESSDGPLKECVMHDCNDIDGCKFYSCDEISEEVYICESSGNLHICTFNTCAHIVESSGAYVCRLSEKVYSSSIFASGGSNGEDKTYGYSFDKAKRTVRTKEAHRKSVVLKEELRKRGIKSIPGDQSNSSAKRKRESTKKNQVKSPEELARARMGRLFGSGGIGAGPVAMMRIATSTVVRTGHKPRSSKRERIAKRTSEKKLKDQNKLVLADSKKRRRVDVLSDARTSSEINNHPALKTSTGLAVLAGDRQRKLTSDETAAKSINYATAVLYDSTAPAAVKSKYITWLSNIFDSTWWFISNSLEMLKTKHKAYKFKLHCYGVAHMIADSGLLAHSYQIVPRSVWLKDNIPNIKESAKYGIEPNDVQRAERTLQCCLNDMPSNDVRLFCQSHPHPLPI